MSSRTLVPPLFALPPLQYDQRYFADVMRAFSIYIVQQQQPGEGRNTTIVLTDLTTNDVGLEPGTIFEVDGYLKISRLSNPHPAGASCSGSVGSVTVVTP
jgi:hypothetical protein